MSVLAQSFDFELFFKPISTESPCGEDLRFTFDYDALMEARRSDNQFADTIGGNLKTADWDEVYELGTRLLTTETKDLQIAVWMVEAMINLQGLMGLRDGLKLVEGIMSRFWGYLHPQPDDDNDFEGRANALSWMDREVSLLITQIPFSQGVSNHIYSFAQWKEAEKYKLPDTSFGLSGDEQMKYEEMKAEAEAEGKITSEQWKLGETTTSREFYQTLFSILGECKSAFLELDRVIDDRFGRYAPGLNNLKKTLTEMQDLVTRVLKDKGCLPGATTSPAQAGQTAPSSQLANNTFPSVNGQVTSSIETGGAQYGPLRSRQDALKMLADVATYYRQAEPHSPIPYLIERAIRWSNLSLQDWLREALKSDEALGNVQDLLGIGL
ncbi:MAG: type VI secretion system protein TssA [Acidobacteria bacterium]|nr:type VI secretion system protein TssA [Acidobacteriota bacterium]